MRPLQIITLSNEYCFSWLYKKQYFSYVRFCVLSLLIQIVAASFLNSKQKSSSKKWSTNFLSNEMRLFRHWKGPFALPDLTPTSKPDLSWTRIAPFLAGFVPFVIRGFLRKVSVPRFGERSRFRRLGNRNSTSCLPPVSI
jgi:hypothetical protein